MKQCWKSNTENTQLTDSETAGGNKGKHPKMQWEDGDTENQQKQPFLERSSDRKTEGCNTGPSRNTEAAKKPPLTADRNTQVDQMEEGALVQDPVQASPGSAAVSSKIPWCCHQAATVLSGGNNHSGDSLSSLSSCSIQATSTELRASNFA